MFVHLLFSQCYYARHGVCVCIHNLVVHLRRLTHKNIVQSSKDEDEENSLA